MCTSVAFKTKDFYFGRNMDLDYHFGDQVVITPRNYPLQFRKVKGLGTHFSIMGVGMIMDNYPLYGEAMNEKGLCMAALDFSGNAYYPEQMDSKKANVSPFEIILWVLGQCENSFQAQELLEKTQLVSVPFGKGFPLTDLHWHIADQDRSIVLECTKSGMHIYENSLHVLTNNPPFEFHMTNLAQYLTLNTGTPKNFFSEQAGIKPFCKGMGSIGLPGDFSSTSRFVKAAYLRLNSICKDDEESSISQFFHILDSVGVVNGSIILENGNSYRTTYSCCINVDKGIYYYKSYNNSHITAINMRHENMDADHLISFSIPHHQSVLWMN